MTMWTAKRLCFLVMLAYVFELRVVAKKFNITVGYLPCIMGENLYRQGLTISGAISLALEEINNSTDILPDVSMQLEWRDTWCDTVTATRHVIDMAEAGVVAFFGPENKCQVEATVAQSNNLPMLSYKCSDYQASKLTNFVRLDPSNQQAVKTIISLLRYYKWNKFSIMYEEPWMSDATVLAHLAMQNNMTINEQRVTPNSFENGDYNNPYPAWFRLIRATKDKTRIYVFLGSLSNLKIMMTVMETQKLFAHGEYMVIYLDMTKFVPHQTCQYFRDKSDCAEPSMCPNTPEFLKMARSLFVIASDELPAQHEEFSNKVRRYNTLPPFSFPDPFASVSIKKSVSIHGAYLYDSVKLYAKALDEIIKEETLEEELTQAKLTSVVKNGTRIVANVIRSSPYQSISGIPIRFDNNGNSLGSFAVFALNARIIDDKHIKCDEGMVPVAHFRNIGEEFPRYHVNVHHFVDWPDSVRPEDEPYGGFKH